MQASPVAMAALMAVFAFAGAPARADPAVTYVACDYYDFQADITYRSRLFTMPGTVAALEAHDVPQFVQPFGEAIKAAYHIAPDPKHLECLVVGGYSLRTAIDKEAALEAGTTALDANERRVDWPPKGQ